MTTHKVTGSYNSATGVLSLILTPVSVLASIPVLNIVLLILLIIYWKSILTVLASIMAFSLIFSLISWYNYDLDGVDKPWKNRLIAYALIIGLIGTPFGWLMNKLHGDAPAKSKFENSASSSNNDNGGDALIAEVPSKVKHDANSSYSTESYLSDIPLDKASLSEVRETTTSSTSWVTDITSRFRQTGTETDFRLYIALAVFVLGLGTVIWTTIGSFIKKKESKKSIPNKSVEFQQLPLSETNIQSFHSSQENDNSLERQKSKTKFYSTPRVKNETTLFRRRSDGFYEMEFQPELTPSQVRQLRDRIRDIRECSVSVGNGKFKTIKTKILDNGIRLVSISDKDLAKVKGFVRDLGYSVSNKVH